MGGKAFEARLDIEQIYACSKTAYREPSNENYQFNTCVRNMNANGFSLCSWYM